MIAGVTTSAPSWTSALVRDRTKLDVGSTAQRVADLLRGQMLDGTLRPGEQLTEEPLVEALKVSRNTVREALSLLSTERLVEHRRHKGMFVRRLDADELTDLCGLRRALEVGAVRDAAQRPGLDEAGVRAVVEPTLTARAARDAGEWTVVGTANSTFHLALAALAGNARLDEAMASVIAEMRLAFIILADPRGMHEPYVEANAALADLVAQGRVLEAADELDAYLRRTQKHLIEAYADTVKDPDTVKD